MATARIVGTGSYVPGDPIDNQELARLTGISFDAGRLESKIGIRARHIARLRGIRESTADFAEKAARAALRDAGVAASEVHLFVVATDTPEHISPATSILLQGRLQGGEMESGAFDVGASCASFVTALDAVARMMMTDPSIRYALVVGVYNMPAYLRPGDEFGWTIFADGAGAVLLRREDRDGSRGYVEGVLKADGTQWNYVGVYARRHSHADHPGGPGGRDLGAGAAAEAPGRPQREALAAPRAPAPGQGRMAPGAGGPPAFHADQQVGHPRGHGDPRASRPEKTTCVMDRYGYTGSACVPMALHTALREGTVKKGDALVLVASGAGLAVGANLIRL